MLKDYMGVINLNEDDSNIKSLVRSRTLASVPIAGRYRIIDFILSSMVNSGIQKVGIFTQSKSRSLIDHLGSGKPWDLDRKINGMFVFNFGISGSYVDDVELFKNNMSYFYKSIQKNVILTSSYMVCNIDFQEAVKNHDESGRNITIIYKKVNNATKSFINCDVLNINKNNKVLSVGKNIGVRNDQDISMEMFIMSKEMFIKLIHECIETGYYRSIKDIIYKNAQELNINAYEYSGYLECINSIDSYYRANMNMLDIKVTKELFYSNGYIYTKVKDEAPTQYCNGCSVSNCLIANGCIIEGKVENSVIFRRVKIGKEAVIKNSIIMQGCEIGDNATVVNTIADKNVIIEKGRELRGDNKFPIVIEGKQYY